MVDGGVKGGVEVVEEVDHFEGRAIGADGSEPDDVGEVNGHLIEFLRRHLHSHLQLVRHRTNKCIIK